MVVSAFAEETQGQVQAKSYDLTFNKKTTGVFGRGVSYEGISLEGKTYDEAVSEINEYANDRLTRYMQWMCLDINMIMTEAHFQLHGQIQT